MAKIKCQKCENEASVFLKNIINGKVTEAHLCEDCFIKDTANPTMTSGTEKEVPQKTGIEQIKEQITAAMQKILPKEKQSESEEGESVKKCPKCGVSGKEMARTGKIGCAYCYDFFGDEIMSIVKRLQDGATRHTGKAPKTISVEKQIKMLTEAMSAAVVIEDYEKAAQLRDQIKVLETQEGVND